MMAVMLSQLGLAAGHRVLEIGTGTGYNAALIARIVGDQKSVVTIDVVPDLIGQTRVNLTAAGYGRVTVVCGDGAAGVPDHAPLSVRFGARQDRGAHQIGVWGDRSSPCFQIAAGCGPDGTGSRWSALPDERP
jgi:protein-L-isoaspartate(D-aspartate) O-methyltransferase